MSKSTWDVYTWVGCGNIVVRESGVPLKEAKKYKEKWKAKSPKHEAFIALHDDRGELDGVLKPKVKTPKSKSDAKAKSKAKPKSDSKGKSKGSSKDKPKKK